VNAQETLGLARKIYSAGSGRQLDVVFLTWPHRGGGRAGGRPIFIERATTKGDSGGLGVLRGEEQGLVKKKSGQLKSAEGN